MGLLLLLFFYLRLGPLLHLRLQRMLLPVLVHLFIVSYISNPKSYITFGLHVICSGINSRMLLFKRFKSVSFLFWEAFHKGFSLEKLLNS